jgi:AcrR family transcriptional regulator
MSRSTASSPPSRRGAPRVAGATTPNARDRVRGSDDVSELEQRLRSVRPPIPVLDRRREGRLTPRQHELLTRLETVFRDGFNHLTMADIAAEAKCSLRTLYSLAPSRDQLVLVVVDRQMWRIGRSAFAAIQEGMTPLDALRAYLKAAWMGVSETTERWAADLEEVAGVRILSKGHNAYVYEITRTLLEFAVKRGDIVVTNIPAVARVMAGLGRDLAQPDVIASLDTSPKQAADDVLDLLFQGLVRTAPPSRNGKAGQPAGPK